MKKTQYLYGVEPSHFKGISAEEVSIEKIRLAKVEIDKLQEVHYLERNDVKINELKEAIEHHEYLLTED